LGISRSGGARNPHVFQYTLRFLRSGGTRPSFARDGFFTNSQRCQGIDPEQAQMGSSAGVHSQVALHHRPQALKALLQAKPGEQLFVQSLGTTDHAVGGFSNDRFGGIGKGGGAGAGQVDGNHHGHAEGDADDGQQQLPGVLV
ncbi:MAG: hypothetical protein ACREYE_14215, partial [Gammaproteobacteria bacterium]